METKQIQNIEFDQAHEALVDALRISFKLLQGAMVLVLIGFLCSGIFVVKQYENAIILRFGKIVGTPADRILKAGLHWAWPYPIDKVIKIPSGRIQSIDINDFWFAQSGDQQDTAPMGNTREKHSVSLRPGLDGYIVCGDVNIVHAKWSLRYQIIDPYLYYINVQDETKLLKSLFINSVIEISGRSQVDTVLRTGIEQFRKSVEARTQQLLGSINCGIKLQRVDIQRVIPPKAVQKSFDDVILAEQEHSQKINEAKSFSATKINSAHGTASKIVSEADSYRTYVIEEAKADSDYLSEILSKYENNPDIFAFVTYQNTIKKILNKLDDKFIFPADHGKKRELRILLNKSSKQ